MTWTSPRSASAPSRPEPPAYATALPHDEDDFGQEEVYVVVAGHVGATVGDDEMDAPVGTAVAALDPALIRSVVAVDAGLTVLAVGCAPGCFRTSRAA